MRRGFAPYLIAATALAFATGAHAAEQPFSVAITTAISTIKSGAEIDIFVTWTNTTDHRLSFAVGGACGDRIHVDVKSAAGLKARKIAYADGFTSCAIGEMTSVEPGATAKEPIGRIANRIYDMAQPGKYYIRVRGSQKLDNREYTEYSNVLAVTVTR